MSGPAERAAMITKKQTVAVCCCNCGHDVYHSSCYRVRRILVYQGTRYEPRPAWDGQDTV